MAYFIQGKDYPVVYCCNYRVGSTAVGTTILEMGGNKIGEHHDPPVLTQWDTLIVESVRHHCDVLVSWWYWRCSSTPFEEFIKNVLDGKHSFLKPVTLYSKFNSNYILRYESLENEWATLCNTAGLEFRPLIRSKSKRPKGIKWQSLYTPKIKSMIVDSYKDEMEKLGYGIN